MTDCIGGCNHDEYPSEKHDEKHCSTLGHAGHNPPPPSCNGGALNGSFLNGLLGTAFHYLGMDEQATHFFELYRK